MSRSQRSSPPAVAGVFVPPACADRLWVGLQPDGHCGESNAGGNSTALVLARADGFAAHARRPALPGAHTTARAGAPASALAASTWPGTTRPPTFGLSLRAGASGRGNPAPARRSAIRHAFTKAPQTVACHGGPIRR